MVYDAIYNTCRRDLDLPCRPAISPVRSVRYKIRVDHNRVSLSFRDAQVQQFSVEGVLRPQPRVPNVHLHREQVYLVLDMYLQAFVDLCIDLWSAILRTPPLPVYKDFLGPPRG